MSLKDNEEGSNYNYKHNFRSSFSKFFERKNELNEMSLIKEEEFNSN